jgi:hypothetical protein
MGACSLKGNSKVTKARTELEGVYEFVSETTKLMKPEKQTIECFSNDWAGMWCFHGTRYSYEMMFKRRPPFPKTLQDLGYLSGAGEFEIKGNVLILQPTISLNQVELLQSKALEFTIQGTTLTLIENMTPYMENVSEGSRTVILRKLD